jgi:parallel beta-helix repeat protein
MFRRLPRLILPSLALLMLGAAALATPVAAAGATRWVDDDGHAGPTSCNGTHAAPKTIQGGIAASSAGDTVKVCPGTYTGAVKIGKRNLKVVSAQTGQAIVRPSATQAADVPLVLIKRAAGALFKGFALEFPTNAPCAGLYYGVKIHRSPYAQLLDNTLTATGTNTEGTCQYQLAIKLESGSHHAKVAGNTLTDYGYGGIDFSQSPNSTIDANTINFLHADVSSCPTCSTTYGIAIDYSSTKAKVTNNTIQGAAAGAVPLETGIWAREATSTIDGNTISYADSGIDVSAPSTGSTVSNNQIDHSSMFGIVLSAVHSNSVVGNNVSTSSYGIVANSASTGNTLTGNTALGNSVYDCVDQTNSVDPSGIENNWTGNTGALADPVEICLPATT